jgi:serine/threonine-protein kinase
VADFGLAVGAVIGQTLTAESSVVLGSVSYLSPEQVQRGVADARSDIYALGIVVFEMLTGKKPYDGQTPIQIAYKHVNERIPNLREVNSTIPQEVADLIYAATAPNPDDRPKDAQAFLSQLRGIEVKIDPKRRQMSLELDLPPVTSSVLNKANKRAKVKVVSALEGFKEKTSQIITSKNNTQQLKGEPAVVTKTRKTSRRVKRNRIIALLLLLSLIFGGYTAFNADRVTVPSLAGMSQKEAAAVVAEIGLSAEIGEEIFSEDIPAGRVISSSPAGGGKIAKAGVVKLIISKGKERILIPNLIGQTPDIATQQLADLGLRVGEIFEVYSEQAEKGFIAKIEPLVGAEVKPNSLVNIFVSKGNEQVSLASYVGLGGEQALSELTQAGFDVKPTYKFSDSVLTGLVISQIPASAPLVDKGSEITLDISKGPEFVFIPNVISKSSNQATLDLENNGLKVVVKGRGAKVISISPKQGSKVKVGSTVTISLG